MATPKPIAGSRPAPIHLPRLGGGEVTIGGPRGGWSLVVVYRGRHCGRCKTYLSKLDTMLPDWQAAGFEVLAVSADPEAKARADAGEFGWRFHVGYDLTEAQMAALGLYISEPLTGAETDRRFAEPGVFVFRPDGSLLLIALSNGPSARPDLAELLDGMAFTKANDRPPRGTV